MKQINLIIIVLIQIVNIFNIVSNNYLKALIYNVNSNYLIENDNNIYINIEQIANN